MAEGNTSGGRSKSRPVLGDLTNRIGKRGFSGREKNGVNCFDFNGKDEVKRICVSPRPCSEINSLKGNVISSLSKITHENRHPNEPGFGSGYAASKSSADACDDCDGGQRLKGKNATIGNSKFHDERNGIKNLDVREGNVISRSVNELDIVGNDLGDSFDQIESSKDDALPRMDETASKKHLDTNLADLKGGKVMNSTSNEADGRSQLGIESSKENENVGAATEVVNENKCSSLVRENVIDLTIISGGEFVLGSSEIRNKENDPKLLDFGRIQSINTEAKDELGDSFSADTSKTVSENGNDCLPDGNNCDAAEVNISLGGTYSDINSHHNDLDDHNAETLASSQSGSVDCTILPQSQESRVFGIDKSSKLKEDECAHTTVGTHSIGACSCSFCTKAAYIWLDIHQKDIKARISALKKSQKDASILAERSYRMKVDEKHGTGSASRVSKLESDLMHQWRSLFQRMTDIWEEEGNQLEASLLPLNNLREKCKVDLELINSKLQEKQ